MIVLALSGAMLRRSMLFGGALIALGLAVWMAQPTDARAEGAGAGKGEVTRLRVGFREIAPLVVTGADGSVSGTEVDLVAGVLRQAGFAIAPVVLPVRRLPLALTGGDVDVVTPGLPVKMDGIVSTRPFLFYQNVAMAIRQIDPPPLTVADLARWRLLAFPGASGVLGDVFRQRVATGEHYSEETQSPVQVLMLQRERVDLMVGERRILKALVNETLPNVQTFEYRLFPPNIYPIYLTRPDYAARIDQVLQRIDPDGAGLTSVDEVGPS